MKKLKAKKMGIFVSAVQHNCDQKIATENKIQNNVRQYKIGKYSCDITKYDFWICGVSQVFPSCFHYGIAKYMPQIRAAFGFEEERLFPVTFGQNEKGAMDSKEFEKYLLGSIVPLYPQHKTSQAIMSC